MNQRDEFLIERMADKFAIEHFLWTAEINRLIIVIIIIINIIIC